MAAKIDVVDGPDDGSEIFEKPGRLSNKLPSPYYNEDVWQMERYILLD